MAKASAPDPSDDTVPAVPSHPEPPVSASAGFAPEADVARAGRWPLVFVACALLALAIVPILQARRIASVEREVAQILEPAGRLGQELILLQARQMARLQAFLLTGDSSLKLRHQELVERERAVQTELRLLAGRANLEIREPLAQLEAASRQWHLGHEGALDTDSLREAYLARAGEEQARYDAVLAAARRLEETVDARVQEGRRRMDTARSLQVRLIVVLALLALGATGAIVVIGRRLQHLVRHAEDRRKDALRARREMQAVLEASGDGVVVTDLQGRCRTLNRTASELLGHAEVDAQGRDVHVLLHGKAPRGRAHPPSRCPILQALRSGVTERRTDDVVWRRDGTAVPAKWHLRPLLDGREVRGAVLTITDMTEIREAEDALRRAVRAREEVLAMVSHDLRNPLGTIIAATALIEEIDLGPEQRREHMGTIRRAADNMRRLIEDLLDVARIEAEGMCVDLRPLELRPLVSDAVDLVSATAREKGIEVENAVDPDLPPVLADGDRIIQVLSNLLGNAVKFTDEGGSVSVAAADEGDGVRVRVSDDGRGIDPEHLEHLFDRFWQVEKGDRQGAGLGLTIAKGIVEAHGGRIEVESEPGRGTTFHFVLSRARTEARTRKRVKERRARSSTG